MADEGLHVERDANRSYLYSDAIYRRRICNLKRTLRRMGSKPNESARRIRHRRWATRKAEPSNRGGEPVKPQRIESNARGDLVATAAVGESPRSHFVVGKDGTQPSLVSSQDGGEHLSESSLQISGRWTRNAKHSKKPRQGFLRTFVKLGKFVCILIGLWKKHANRVREFLDNVDMVSVDEITDLLFDKTDYSADKRARISSDTKRILSMPHHLRTENDIRYVEIALRNYPSIAAYPVSIQNLIARKAWYELYAGKRIIVKQGHVARCFYFILSGKVIISKQEEDSRVSRTLCYLNKGDSFGEVALINKTHRTASVISDGTVELLVVTDEDYEEIFTSGGLTEKYFPFLKGISCFQDWPIELLFNNINKATITYYKRKALICENTSTTPWLYVIKSGSVTVLKKLKEPKQKQHEEENQRRLELQQLSSEEHYRHLCEVIQESNKLSRKDLMIRHHRLKELGLSIAMTTTQTSAKSTGNKMDAIDEVSAANSLPKLQPVTNMADSVASRRQLTTWQMGPMVTRTGMMSSFFNEDVAPSVADSDQRSQLESANFNASRRVSFETPQDEDKEMKEHDCFVTVQTLVKGDVFGVADLIHGKQPTFILVSNGAECIMIDRRLYWEKATDNQKLMRKLKDEVLSYPTDEKMQSDLVVALNWEKYRQKTFQRALRRAHLEKKLKEQPMIGLSVR